MYRVLFYDRFNDEVFAERRIIHWENVLHAINVALNDTTDAHKLVDGGNRVEIHIEAEGEA